MGVSEKIAEGFNTRVPSTFTSMRFYAFCTNLSNLLSSSLQLYTSKINCAMMFHHVHLSTITSSQHF